MPQEFEKEYAAQGDLWGKGVEGVNQKKNQYTFNITESSSKKLWGFSLLLILAAMIIIASLYFFVFHSREQQKNAEIVIQPIDEVFSGKSFPIKIAVTNISKEKLLRATLSASLPEGFFFEGQSKQLRVIDLEPKDFDPDQTEIFSIPVISSAPIQTVQRVGLTLKYSTENSSQNTFQQQSFVDILTSRSEAEVRIETPKFAFNGKNFDIVVKYRNNTKEAITNASLTIEYPNEFRPSITEKSPNRIHTVSVDRLDPGEEETTTFSGALFGPSKAFFNYRAVFNTTTAGQSYESSAQTASIAIYPEPLEIGIILNGGASVVGIDDELAYQLTIYNNADIPFRDIVIKAQLTGALYKFSSAATDASFDSLNNTFTWTVANTPELSNLEPGQQKTVSLRIRTNPDFPITGSNDKNFILTLNAHAESPTVPSNTAATRTSADGSIQTKIEGKASLVGFFYHNDPDFKGLNKGVFPPKANQPSQYTIHWVIRNYGVDIKNARVIGFLQSNTKFISVVKNTGANPPVYDPNTGQVSWDVGDVKVNYDKNAAPVAVFQIETVPAINQVGSPLVVLGKSEFRAIDTFTGNPITGSIEPLRSDNISDKHEGKSGNVEP